MQHLRDRLAICHGIESQAGQMARCVQIEIFLTSEQVINRPSDEKRYDCSSARKRKHHFQPFERFFDARSAFPADWPVCLCKAPQIVRIDRHPFPLPAHILRCRNQNRLRIG